MIKLTPYQKTLETDKKDLEKELAPNRAEQIKKKGELEIMKIEESIIKQESSIKETTSIFPIDFNSIITALDNLALLERKAKQLKQIMEELFPK